MTHFRVLSHRHQMRGKGTPNRTGEETHLLWLSAPRPPDAAVLGCRLSIDSLKCLPRFFKLVSLWKKRGRPWTAPAFWDEEGRRASCRNDAPAHHSQGKVAETGRRESQWESGAGFGWWNSRCCRSSRDRCRWVSGVAAEEKNAGVGSLWLI